MPLVGGLAAIGLAGCVNPSADETGRYTAPIGDAPVIAPVTNPPGDPGQPPGGL